MTDDPHARRAEGNAGAFLAPFSGVVPVPIDPVDGLAEAPADPEDGAQVATPPPKRSFTDALLGRNPPPPRDP